MSFRCERVDGVTRDSLKVEEEEEKMLLLVLLSDLVN